MTLTQVFSTARPVRIVYGDSQDPTPTLIINRDLVNAVVYGDQDIASLNSGAYSIIDPLGSITVDGTTDIWVTPLSGSPTVDVIPGAANWTPSPALVATQISTLGIPILRGTNQLGSALNQTVAAASTVTLLNSVGITQPSFESVFKLNLPAASGTIPFAILSVGWQDSITGLQVGVKQYALTCGNGAASALMFYLSGPTRGSQLVLTLQNLDPAQTLTYSWLFNETSHVYSFDKLLQPSYATTSPITFTNPSGNPSKGLLFAASPTVGPNGSILRLCAASNAKCKINIDNSAQANPWALSISDPASLYNAAANNEFYKFNGVAGSVFQTEIQLPNGPTLFNLQNSAATNTITLGVTLTAMEY